ncbi:hypothetical protein ACIA8K_29285 [Catenuloplanes sp. NPDC051500]|uniref:hypothetical protein n=1 Tax=Catenuloplanes sp. NPDC051500 TaxID=3363959 RepID=UPI0037907E53
MSEIREPAVRQRIEAEIRRIRPTDAPDADIRWDRALSAPPTSFDSLDVTSLLVSLEDAFDAEIELDDALRTTEITPGDILRTILDREDEG